jgi:hypothetical protein
MELFWYVLFSCYIIYVVYITIEWSNEISFNRMRRKVDQKIKEMFK